MSKLEYLAWSERSAGVLVAAAVSASVVLTFWLAAPESVLARRSSDYEFFYKPVADSILAGNGLKLADGSIAHRYPPAHPTILAAAIGGGRVVGMSDDAALRLLTLLCFGATSAFLFLISRDLWGGRLGLLVPLAFSAYPFALWLSREPLSEVTFLPALAATVWMFWNGTQSDHNRTWWFFFSGLLAGVTMLIRPAAIGLALVLAVLAFACSLKSRPRFALTQVAIVLAGSLVVTAPWVGFVAAKTGAWIPLSTGGPESMLDGLTFAIVSKDYRKSAHVPESVQRYMSAVLAKYQEGAERKSVARVALAEARNQPVGAVRLFFWKLVRSWYATDVGRYDRFILAVQIPFLVVLCASATFAWKIGGKHRLSVLMVLCLVAYFWLATITALSILRYMVPAICIAFLMIPAPFRLGRKV